MVSLPARTAARRRLIRRCIVVLAPLAALATVALANVRSENALVLTGIAIGMGFSAALARDRDGRVPRRFQLRAAADIVGTQEIVQARFASLNTHIERLEADLDAHRQAAMQLEHFRTHDRLTDLPNRDQLIAILNASLEDSPKRPIAILCINIDRFHTANATLGRERADALLQALAIRINGAIEPQHILSRVGGDEFIIVARECSAPAMLAKTIQEAIAHPFLSGNEPIVISASIGVSRYPTDAADAITLVEYSTIAMHDAKRHGSLSIAFYTQSAGILNPLTFAAQLRNATQAGELVVYYQPIICVTTGRAISAEALVRWDHPTRGHIGPLEFIPLAEETGLINEITLFALEEACKMVASLPLDDHAPFSIAVNVSAFHLHQPDFASNVRRVLRKQKVAAHRIDLELTETLMADYSETTVKNMKELRASGIRLSIDDFGTGYSSLSYVKRLPINKLKIDRSFITDIVNDPVDRNIASTIIALARTLDLDVIAEGIETHEQLALVTSLGVDSYQGYLVSRPLNPGAFAVFLRAHSRLLLTAQAEAVR